MLQCGVNLQLFEIACSKREYKFLQKNLLVVRGEDYTLRGGGAERGRHVGNRYIIWAY